MACITSRPLQELTEMATNFAHVTAAPVSPPGAASFLLNPAKRTPDFAAALEAAVVAEAASHDVRRNTRCRLSYLICEVANQLRQQGGGFEFDAELPLSRYDLAELLDISLCKVKRAVALLSLSGVISTDGRTIQVLDWRRLCSVAHVDPARLTLAEPEDEDDYVEIISVDERPSNLVTASGEPACFV